MRHIFLKIVIAVFLLMWVSLPDIVLATSDPGRDVCDDLAAHPSDPKRRASGVDWDELQVLDALDACQAAAREHPGVIRFTYQLARALGRDEDYRQSLPLMRRAANEGYASAEVSLGWMYAKGLGVPADLNIARKWYEKAALQNHSVALLNLGVFYITGKGVEVDIPRGVDYLIRASQLGNSRASFNLSVMSKEGQSGLLKAGDEIPWLIKSADQGNLIAGYEVADKYLTGDGLPVDRAKARKWFLQSGERGYFPSARKLCITPELLDDKVIRYLWCASFAPVNEEMRVRKSALFQQLDKAERKLVSELTKRFRGVPKFRSRKQASSAITITAQ